MFSNSCDDGEILVSLTSMDALFPLSVKIDGCARIFALFSLPSYAVLQKIIWNVLYHRQIQFFKKSLRSFPLTPSSKPVKRLSEFMLRKRSDIVGTVLKSPVLFLPGRQILCRYYLKLDYYRIYSHLWGGDIDSI